MIRNELIYVLGEKQFDVKKVGNRGKLVRLIQEWLCLNNLPVVIDGIYGPATERAVVEFQKVNGLSDDGWVSYNTFGKLTAPMRRVFRKIQIDDTINKLGATTLAYARLHLKQHPREVGGQNRGPWVRLYMLGNEGKRYPWCAGFVSFHVRQASQALEIENPLKYCFSVGMLAFYARRAKQFLSHKSHCLPGPGYIFLQKSKRGYSHCGIVNVVENEYFTSIEGNTNDSGSAEGYEVCARIRSYKNKDFVII